MIKLKFLLFNRFVKSIFFLGRKLVKLNNIICRPFYLKNLLLYNVAAAVEHQKIIKNLDFDLLIDAGANKGQFSLLCLYYNKKIKIVAFEPIKSCLKIYETVFKGYFNVKVFNTALGSKVSNTTMNISNSIDSSSILNNKIQNDIFTGTQSVNQTNVKVDKLDNYCKYFLSSTSLLKIDVQGYELLLLKGATKSLKTIKYIFVELSFVELYESQPLFSDVYDFLRKSNFKMIDISYLYHHDKMLVQGDFLFINNKYCN